LFGSLEQVSEWQLVWNVKLEYANLADNNGYLYREVIVETPAQLRKVIEWARRNPGIVGFPHTTMRRQVGERPEVCRYDHRYQTTGSFRRTHVDWSDCGCGGHFVYVCGDCEDMIIDPPVYDDCTVSQAEALGATRGRLLAQKRGR
jgi:hypothetical protein